MDGFAAKRRWGTTDAFVDPVRPPGRDAHCFVPPLVHMHNGLARFLEWSQCSCNYYPHGFISKCNGIHKGVRESKYSYTGLRPLIVYPIAGFLHQLYSIFRTRLDCTFEWFWIPGIRSTPAAERIDDFKKTYRTEPPSNSISGIRGFPSSSKTGTMSNTDSMQVTARYIVRSAMYLPGQILQGFTEIRLFTVKGDVSDIPLPPSTTENTVLWI